MPKAYVFTRYGGPETEAFVDVDRPSPGTGRLLVEEGHARGKTVIEVVR